jgi:glutamyl-tRNA synthetase
VRLKVPEHGAITRWNDQIAGPCGEEPTDIDDFVIARSDGSAIYHFAVVVDDHDMGVTHVIRGREHMTSTPRQLLLYQALGWDPPRFAHVPLLVSPSGKKLSKREGDVSVQAYRDRGFPPEAMLNYLARLGWSHGDLEVFDREELVALFSLEEVGHSPSQVHEDKLIWLSQQHLKRLPRERLLRYLQPFLDAQIGRAVEVDARLEQLVELLRTRCSTLVEMAEQARFACVDSLEWDEAAARRLFVPEVRAPLRDLETAFAALESWDEASLEKAANDVLERHHLKLGRLAQPLRLAITGRTASPGIFETLIAAGRERALRRIRAAVDSIPAPNVPASD